MLFVERNGTNALLRAKAGKAEELGARLSALVTTSRLEEGTLLYELHRSLEDPSLWTVYEIFKHTSKALR